MPNVLTVNEPRLGWFYDDLPQEITPTTATMLRDDGQRITLTIPWQGFDDEYGQLSRWFQGDSVHWGDDPDRSKFSYELPSELGFNDADGSVTLVGCHVAGYRSNLGRAAHGIVSAQFAVFGATDLRWGKVNSLRTHIPGLSEWTRITGTTERHVRDSDGRLERFDVSLSAVADVRLERRLNLSLVSSWRVERGGQGEPLRLFDDVLIQTDIRQARDWATHLDRHRAVQQLLEIAAWRPFGIASLKAKRDTDPLRVISGEAVGPGWVDVRTYAVRQPKQPEPQRTQFLFGYDDIGPAGVRRWLKLREQFSRGILPIVSLHDVEAAHVETQLTQSSVGLEAIGYQLAIDSGATQKAANALNFSQRAELIRKTIDFDAIPKDWPARAAEAYNGFKHANRPLPDVDAMYRAHRENLLVFRLWVALRIGAQRRTLLNRLQTDPVAMQVRTFSR